MDTIRAVIRGAILISDLDLTVPGQEKLSFSTCHHIIAQYQIAKAQVAAAKSTLKESKISYADTILKAPFDGTIVQRLKQPGDMGLAGAPIVAMHNASYSCLILCADVRS
jgi:hypothetical protein